MLEPEGADQVGWRLFPREPPHHPPSTPAPTLTLPIYCLRCCIPIRSISQPGGSGYRRLNDKVPPLPARPASRLAGTRPGFSTLSAAQEEARTAELARTEQSGVEVKSRVPGAQARRFCARFTLLRPQGPALLPCSPFLNSGISSCPGPEATPSPLQDEHHTAPEASLTRDVSQQTPLQPLPKPRRKPQVLTAPGNQV